MKKHIAFLLDETGSMNSIKDDTIGGFNAYLDTLGDSGATFTLVKFDSNRYSRICKDVPISEAPRLSEENYVPGAMTNLVDSMVKLINETLEHTKKKDRVVMVVQTDGQENASRKHTTKELAKLVKKCTKKRGWEFVYLGAGIDAFSMATDQLGISASRVMSYDRIASKQAFAATAANVADFMEDGDTQAIAFKEAQRASAGDKFHKKKRS